MGLTNRICATTWSCSEGSTRCEVVVVVVVSTFDFAETPNFLEYSPQFTTHKIQTEPVKSHRNPKNKNPMKRTMKQKHVKHFSSNKTHLKAIPIHRHAYEQQKNPQVSSFKFQIISTYSNLSNEKRAPGSLGWKKRSILPKYMGIVS